MDKVKRYLEKFTKIVKDLSSRLLNENTIDLELEGLL